MDAPMNESGSNHPIDKRTWFAVLAVAAFFLFGAGLSAAQEQRMHQIVWGHTAPETVSSFVVLLSPVEGSLENARRVDVGLPPAQASGILSTYAAMVSFDPDEFLAVAAIGHDGQMSLPSGWGGMQPTRPGQPLLAEP